MAHGDRAWKSPTPSPPDACRCAGTTASPASASHRPAGGWRHAFPRRKQRQRPAHGGGPGFFALQPSLCVVVAGPHAAGTSCGRMHRQARSASQLIAAFVVGVVNEQRLHGHQARQLPPLVPTHVARRTGGPVAAGAAASSVSTGSAFRHPANESGGHRRRRRWAKNAAHWQAGADTACRPTCRDPRRSAENSFSSRPSKCSLNGAGAISRHARSPGAARSGFGLFGKHATRPHGGERAAA